MTIQENTFAAACYNDLSIADLEAALTAPADTISMRDWSISEAEYFAAIHQALDEKKADAIDERS